MSQLRPICADTKDGWRDQGLGPSVFLDLRIYGLGLSLKVAGLRVQGFRGLDVWGFRVYRFGGLGFRELS